MAEQGASRFVSIEGARALLALWVVWGHLVQQAGVRDKWRQEWIAAQDPNIAVFVFMIISGFVITHLITEKREAYAPYITRRFFRLAPLLWACLAFILAYDIAYPKVYQWDNQHDAAYLIGYATMLHAVVPHEVVPDMARSILPPAWSISLEWQFYLLAPLLLWRRAWPVLIVAGVASVFLTSRSVANWTGYTFDTGFLPVSIMYFLVGIGSYFVAKRMSGQKLPTYIVLAASMAVFAATKGNWPLAIWVVILGAAISPNMIRSFLETRVMLWLGAASYSIYLVHMIVIMPVRKQLLEGMLGLQFGTWTYLWTMTAIAAPIIIAVSFLTWWLIERPGQKLGLLLARGLHRKPAKEKQEAALAPAE